MVQAPTKFEPVINIKRSGYLKKLVALAEEVIDRRGHGAALSADILHRAAARVDGTYGDGCWLGRDTGCRLLARSRRSAARHLRQLSEVKRTCRSEALRTGFDPQQTLDVRRNRLPGCRMTGVPACLSGILRGGLMRIGIG